MSWRRWTIDTGPLRTSRDFRILLSTQTISSFGANITYVAIPLQVARITHSPLAVGLLGLCELGPLLITALLGGALADYIDRRKLVIIGELSLMTTAVMLLLNALLAHPMLWVLYAVAGLAAALDGLQRPAIEGILPRLVTPDELPAVNALRSMTGNTAQLLGPAAAGVMIAAFGFGWAYTFNIVTFLLSLGGLVLIRATPPPPEAERPSIAGIAAGLRYARSRPELMGTYAVDIVAMFFGMPMALFPFIAEKLGGISILGLLYAAPAAGALLAALTSGWISHVRRHGLAVIVSAIVWGAAIIGFGGAHHLWMALAFLALAGAGDEMSGIFRDTIWSQTIPDRLRGRLAGVEMLSYSIGPTLGNAESGLAARALGVGGSVVSGGIACVVGVVALAALLPAFRHYDGPTGIARKRAEDELVTVPA
ncbi:MAG TPA: MFS transporter [Micromonosporaceae bacterium]|jgi:MFS family permease